MYKKKAGAPGSSAFPTVQCVHSGTTSALCKAGSWTTSRRTCPTRGHALDSSPFRAEPLTWKVQTEESYLDTFSTTSLDALRRGSQQFPFLRSESRKDIGTWILIANIMGISNTNNAKNLNKETSQLGQIST